MENYQWNMKDKLLYLLSMIPFIVLLLCGILILSKYNFIYLIIWIFLYIIVNIFQAGCCVGCPYRGKYCPAFCGVFLGNILSVIFYKNRTHNEKFFKINANGGETFLTIFFLFPLYWIFITKWYFVLIYIGLIMLHIFLFMPTQCPKCSYNQTCPGGKAYKSYKKIFTK